MIKLLLTNVFKNLACASFYLVLFLCHSSYIIHIPSIKKLAFFFSDSRVINSKTYLTASWLIALLKVIACLKLLWF